MNTRNVPVQTDYILTDIQLYRLQKGDQNEVKG